MTTKNKPTQQILQSPPPAKIKSYLADVKANLLDNDNDAAVSAKVCYRTLLVLEMLQRGVLLLLDGDNDNDTATTTAVLDNIRNVAGKSCLSDESSSLPKPLLAGANVIAGRIAEQVATVAVSDNDQDLILLDLASNNSGDVFKAALDRCKEVQDDRFRLLLSLAGTSEKSVQTHPPGNSNDDGLSQRQASAVIRIQLLLIAESYYYNAITFQQDSAPPMMWKRAWDVVKERKRITLQTSPTPTSILESNGETSWEAVYALSNLQSIAQSKGNTKRVLELDLLLAESYLDTCCYHSDSDSRTTTMKDFLTTFIQPYRTIEPLERKNALQKASETLQHLKEQLHGGGISDDDAFLMKILELRILLDTETTTIEETATTKYTKTKNRAEDSSNKTRNTKSTNAATLSMTSMRCTVRQRYLVENDDSTLEAAAKELIEALLEKQQTTTAETGDDSSRIRMIRSAWELTHQYVRRCVDKAQAKAIRDNSVEGWSVLATETLQHILGAWLQRLSVDWETVIQKNEPLSARAVYVQELLKTIVNVEERDLIETVVALVPRAEWMCCGRIPYKPLFSPSMLCFVRDLQRQFHEDLTKEKAASSVVGAVVGEDGLRNKRALELECAMATTRSLIAFAREECGHTGIHDRTRAAIKRSESSDRYGSYGEKFGFPYFDFLVAWSGICRQPWQYVTISEARLLLSRARDCVSTALKCCGRVISWIEEVALNLGQAEMEGAAFVGGLLEDAGKLYNRVLESTDRHIDEDIQDFLLCRIIRTRCFAGLSTLYIRGGFDNESSTQPLLGQDYAERSLRELQEYTPQTYPELLYMWSFRGVVESSVCYQLASSRQLVAESLIRGGNDQDAKRFLEDAVADAPSDSGAALALGAFMLRMMFFRGNRSPKSDKPTHIQLLKSAKLDSTKSDPFALLGYWYVFSFCFFQPPRIVVSLTKDLLFVCNSRTTLCSILTGMNSSGIPNAPLDVIPKHCRYMTPILLRVEEFFA